MKLKDKHFLFPIFLTLLLLLAACGTQPIETAPAAAQSSETDANLLTYTNEEYGFSLHYPASWTVTDVSDENFVGPGSRSVQFSQGTVMLIIGYRHAGDETMIFGTGAPAGELEVQGMLSVNGQDVERVILVSDGKAKSVFYGEPGTVLAADGLEFAASLADFAQVDYDTVELTQQTQDEADLIVGSLTRVGQ